MSLGLVTPQNNAVEPEAFQVRLIESISSAVTRRPSPPCLLRAPTGSGKTFVLARVLEKVNAKTPTLWLWLVPYVNLVQQTEDALATNAVSLTPVMLSEGRNQEATAGQVWLSTAAAVARARDRTKGYDNDADDDRRSLAAAIARARIKNLKIGLVVDEAHIGLDKATEFGLFAKWLAPDYLLAATATPNDERLKAFIAESGNGAFEQFSVSRAEVVDARLNKRFIEAVVYDLRQSMQSIADLKLTVLKQAWKRHRLLKAQLQEAGITLVPLLLVQVGNGDKTVDETEADLRTICKVPAAAIGKHSADAPDPVLMAAIANDLSKEVLIFKQSAGTGFDAPRAFVLASTKPVNDPDFATQFMGRVMRVARPIRARFPKPVSVPPHLDTAYIYLADATAQQGFEQAVHRHGAVVSQLEGATEKLYERKTESGATIYMSRPTVQPPLDYNLPITSPQKNIESFSLTTPAAPVSQHAFFGWDESGDDVKLDIPVQASRVKNPIVSPPATRSELFSLIDTKGIRVYPLRHDIKSLPKALKRECRPELANMEAVSLTAATRLPISEELARIAIKVALNRLTEKERHTEMTLGTHHQEDVQIITDRKGLASAARIALASIPYIEEADAAVIVKVLSGRLAPRIEDAFEVLDEDQRPSPTTLERHARDASLWVIHKEWPKIAELMQDLISKRCTIEDAASLPEAMLFPHSVPLVHSERNVYGVLPPSDDQVERAGHEIYADMREFLNERVERIAEGAISVAPFDGGFKLNQDELSFAMALDRSEFVTWWHRNPDRKSYSVRLVRSEHRNYFYPDFVVCLKHTSGDEALQRLIETKHDTKDASNKAARTPLFYGKVLFLTKDKNRLRIVNDDGSLGGVIDEDDLTTLQSWMQATAPI